jgi:hypothetical protein
MNAYKNNLPPITFIVFKTSLRYGFVCHSLVPFILCFQLYHIINKIMFEYFFA